MIRQAGLEDVVKVESAGTHAFHAGEAPDKRAITSTHKRGFDIGDLRASSVKDKNFEDYDLILAMDWDNLSLLQQSRSEAHTSQDSIADAFCDGT